MIPNTSTKIDSIRRVAARLIVGAVLFGGQAFASPASATGAGNPFSSDRMLAHMTRQLNLTDAQAQQVKQVLDARQSQISAQFQSLKSAREALHQAVLASPVNEGAIRNAAAALGQAEGDAALLHAQVHAQIVPLLTPDQQQKFATFGMERHGRGKGFSHGATD